MTIFESLLLAHIVGDWLLQTEWQANNKIHKWQALLSHVIVYHLVILAVLIAWFGFRNTTVYITVAVLAVTHAVLDLRRPVEWIMKMLRHSVTNQSERWLVIVIDQSIHIILIGLASLFLSR